MGQTHQKPSTIEIEFRAYCLHLLRRLFRRRLNELGITDNDQVIRDAAEAAKQLDNERPKHTLILVDEFQDTDRHQWDMLDHLYPDESERLMVMVGDPNKQSTDSVELTPRSTIKSEQPCPSTVSGIWILFIGLRRRWLMGSMRYSIATVLSASSYNING